MSLFAVAMSPAADTTTVQAGGTSLLDDLGNALTAGAAGAAISGLGSIYNTGAAGINLLGGSVEEIDTYKKLQEIDTNWADYYRQNQNAIDVVGFIGSSLIPGSLAIKGLNMVRAGGGLGAFGRSMRFAQTKQAEAVSAAVAELATEGGTVFTRINKNKMAAMAWGFADQALTAAAFEVGVAATMKQSPLLADDSWWDIGKSALVGATFGGFIGGGIDSLVLNKSFRNAVKQLDGTSGKYGYVSSLEKMNLTAGDEAYVIVDSLLALPKNVAVEDATMKFSFNTAKGLAIFDKDVSGLLGNKLKSTKDSGLLDFETTIRKLAPDEGAAESFANFTINRFKSMQAAGKSDAEIREAMGDTLFNLKSVSTGTEEALTSNQELWYFKKALSQEEIAGINSVEDYVKAVQSNTPFTDNAYSKPYIFTGTVEQRATSIANAARIGSLEGQYPTLTAAWKAGKDVAIMSDNTLRINDGSRLWRRIDDNIYSSKQYLNTRTGAMTEDTVLTAADQVRAGGKLDARSLKKDAVYLETKTGNKVLDMKVFNEKGDTTYYTARHAWASKLADKDLPKVIDVNDFSLMDRLRSVDTNTLEEMQLAGNGIQLERYQQVIGDAANQSIPDVIKSAKLSKAQELFMDAYEAGTTLDVRAVAYQLNVDAQWLETAIATRFRESMAGDLRVGSKTIDPQKGISLPLESYLQRENLIVDYKRPQQFMELGAITPGMSWRDKVKLIQESVNTNGGQFVTGDLAWGQRVRDAIRVTKEAGAATLSEGRAALLMDISQDAAKQVDSTGVGASMFTSANANYGEPLKLWAQDTGKHLHKWIQEDVDAVVTALGTVATKLRASPKAAGELGVLTNLLRSSDEKYIWHPTNPKQMILRELGKLNPATPAYGEAVASITSNGRRAIIDVEDDLVVEFLKTHTTLNGERIGKRTVLNNARGFTSNMVPETVYVPPVDTTYFQHFAFVRPIANRAFSTSEVSMIFGRDAAELSKKMAAVDRSNFDVITKDGTEKYFKAKEAYDFDLTINEPRINSELRKSGALNNFQPEVRAENLIEDYMRWHQNQASRLVRDSVETFYAQQFAEIRKMGQQYNEIATSKFAGTLSKSRSEIVNPIDDYLKTALDISKRSEYTFLHQANEFVDALGTRAYRAFEGVFGDAKKGVISWQEANTQMEKLGLKGHYSNEADFFAANVPRDRNIVREYIAKANSLLANSVLRLDFFNSVLNTVSTPLMLSTELASIKSLVKNDPALLGKLGEALSIGVPGLGGAKIPNTTKLIAQSVANYAGPERAALVARYTANGDIKSSVGQMHSMLDNLALRADFKVFSESVDKAFEMGAKLTLNEQAEQATRFIAADVMRILTDPAVEAGKLSVKEQNAYISVFVNRVQGNYISSQRPIVFQGVLGSAVSLFQTYSFNVMQQLARHVENKDRRAIATLFGMQAATFGLNGTPFFDAVNSTLIGNAAINQGNHDAYSMSGQILGKEAGDWLMYGTVSAFPGFGDSWPALYTRGDINPRHMTILPVNPLDIPAIDGATRVVKNLLDTGKKLIAGADVSESLLQGLEHNGINRPLAGFAQVLNGKVTTSKGSLISAASDFNGITTASRILGSRPMEEAIAINAQYRVKAYQTADRERLEFLGEKAKSFLYKNQVPPPEVMEDLMNSYARAGGRIENFNAALQRWSRYANKSVIENLRGNLGSSYGQRLSEIMGGVPLDDYQNQPMVLDETTPTASQ